MLHGHWAHFPWANKSRVHLSDIICESSAVGESSFICYFDLKRRQIEVSRKLNKEALAFQWWSSNSPCVPRIRDYWGLWLSPLSLPMCSVFSLSSLLFSTSSPSSDVTRKESSGRVTWSLTFWEHWWALCIGNLKWITDITFTFTSGANKGQSEVCIFYCWESNGLCLLF